VANKPFRIKPLTALIAGALIGAAASTSAQYVEPDAKRIKQDYPLKSTDPTVNTMKDWLVNNPTNYALNPVNLRAGFHPDRDDPDEKGGDYDVVYIFPDAATANAWWDPTLSDTPPDEIPDDAVALIHWELDNGSGSFPGIMSKSDVNGFKSRNCIMAAGDVIPDPDDPSLTIPKTCSNPQGTAKRFKLNVLKPDVPIDLVYNVELEPLTYTNYDSLPTFDGVEESGRIYRALQKWNNATAMDSASEERDGVRIVGFSLALGQGVGGDFVHIPDADGTGLEVDKALGFELRPCMPDHFFDVSRPRPGAGNNPCSTESDSTNQRLPQEIWLEEEYATFSPTMYSFVDDKRMVNRGIPGGFWDKRPAGIYPPAIQTLGLLDSGAEASDADVYWDSRVDGASPLAGYIGAITPNYFDIIATQAAEAGATTVDNVPLPNPFGYLAYQGVLSDGSYGPFGDSGTLPQGIYRDDDGDPATEGGLIAWWDGLQYRWGIDGAVFDGVVEPDQAFAPVDLALLQQWAELPLLEEPDFDLYPDTGYPPGPRYELGVTDDLGGLNIDYFVYLGRNYDADASPTFTIRMEPVSVGDVGIEPGDYGNEEPAWVGNPAPPLETFLPGPVESYDVGIQQVRVAPRVQVGGSLSVAVRLFNDGPDDASGTVTVTGSYLLGTELAEITFTSDFEQLAANRKVTIQFGDWTAPPSPTEIMWSAVVEAPGDTDPSNNSAEATTVVTGGGGPN